MIPFGGRTSLGHYVLTDLRYRNRNFTYQFRDHTGRVVTTTSKDCTKSLSKGMTVPVVYERSKPENNLALCSVNFGDFEVLR